VNTFGKPVEQRSPINLSPESISMPALSHLTRIGPYEIRGILAKNPTWRVYKAYEPNSHRDVVLKVISKDVLRSFAGDMAARIQGEARAAIGLQHPGIISIYDHGEDSELAFIAMEYVEGWHLREHFRVPTNDAVTLIGQVLEALDYAHQRGMIHRAINPSNLLLSREGRLRIGNFGVVRLGNGMPGYLAPEQFMGQDLDCRCDVFSSGVIFYELLTGMSPFPGPLQDISARVCNQKEKPPSAVTSNISPAFDESCARALAKEVNNRYPSARAFLDDLRRAQRKASVELPLSSQVSDQTILAHASFTPERASTSGPAVEVGLSPAVPKKTTLTPLPSAPPALTSSENFDLREAKREPDRRAVPAPGPVLVAKGISISKPMHSVGELIAFQDSLANYYDDLPCPPQRVIPVFVAILEALIALGPANCSLEALVPLNIRLDPFSKVNLPRRQAAQSSGACTPRYTAPETITDKAYASDPDSAAAHIYALGMMFYEILLGKRLVEKVFANLRSDLSWLRWQADFDTNAALLKSVVPECPAALSDLIQSMTEKHIEKRQLDLHAILLQLKEFAKRSNKTIVLQKSPAPRKLENRASRKKTSRWVLILMICLVVGGAIFLALRKEPALSQLALSAWRDLIARLQHLIHGS
jgi:serine/threonine protein kinase